MLTVLSLLLNEFLEDSLFLLNSSANSPRVELFLVFPLLKPLIPESFKDLLVKKVSALKSILFRDLSPGVEFKLDELFNLNPEFPDSRGPGVIRSLTRFESREEIPSEFIVDELSVNFELAFILSVICLRRSCLNESRFEKISLDFRVLVGMMSSFLKTLEEESALFNLEKL